jgi:hypothetical protein
MVVLDGNFALGCGYGTDYTYIQILQCVLERTDAITNEVLQPITFVLAYPTVTIWSKLTVYNTLAAHSSEENRGKKKNLRAR